MNRRSGRHSEQQVSTRANVQITQDTALHAARQIAFLSDEQIRQSGLTQPAAKPLEMR